MAKHNYGRRYKPDVRDRRFRISRTASERTYRFWQDHRCWQDQKATPHCVGFAWSHWLASAPIRSWIDPDGLYGIAKRFDEWKGTNYDGTSVRAGAKVLKWLGLIERYEWAWDVDTLLDAVLDRGPVVVGTNWHKGMDRPNKDAVLSATGNNLGGHAYLITGASKERGLFRIKNSWGQTWGRKGRAFITFDDMAALLKKNGEACLAIERAAKPPA
jgi:hypothetical protein